MVGVYLYRGEFYFYYLMAYTRDVQQLAPTRNTRVQLHLGWYTVGYGQRAMGYI